jgi:hypothetical protein
MIDVFAAYLRERFRPRVFGPAVVVHAAAALWATGTGPGVTSSAVALGLAVALLLQFRLWDDLEDRERDRHHHPLRVLVRSDPTPFRVTCALLAVANVVLLATTGARAAALGLVCLDVFFWAAYGPLRSRLSDRVWRFHVLLLKYPVFVVLMVAALGPLVPGRLLASSLAVYLCAYAYESLHDRELPLGALS